MRLGPDYRDTCVTINQSNRYRMLFECMLEEENTARARSCEQFYGIYYHICHDDCTIIASAVTYSLSQRP